MSKKLILLSAMLLVACGQKHESFDAQLWSRGNSEKLGEVTCHKSQAYNWKFRCFTEKPETTITYNISMGCELDWELDHLVPEAKAKALRLLSLARENGLSVKVYETQRGLCRQTKMLKIGTSSRLDSKHLVGEAFDMVFMADGQKSWSKENPWDRLGELGKSIGLLWGGDFKTSDPGHFELPPLQPF